MTDTEFKPFATRAWNQTSAKSCSQNLLWLAQGYEPKEVRPDRFQGVDRRNRGTALHDFARLSLHLLFERGKWPHAEKTLHAVLARGGGKDGPGDPMGFMRGPGFNNLMDVIGELLPKAVMFQERFEFDADARIGSEHFVAVDGDGEVASYFDVPAGGYHGRIDWAEMAPKSAPKPNQLRVIDFKNYPAIHPRSELRAHEQLSFYAWMLAKHYPQTRKVPARIGIYYFEYGVTNEEELSWDEIDANVERLMARIRHKRGLRIVDIAPEPGFGRCQYCEFIGDCAAGKDLLDNKLGAVVDAESAVKAAKSLFVIDELRKATLDALKEYCKEHGPIRLDGDAGYGFVSHAETEYDVKNVAKTLKDSGIDPWQVMRIDKEALAKITKDNEVVDKAVKLYMKVSREGTTFKAFKPKDESKVVTTPKIKGRVKAPKEKKPKKTGVMVTPKQGEK